MRDRAREGSATSVGEALVRVGNLARQRSYVVVVSDFRGPRDWRRPLLMLGGRHHVVAIEIRDAREQELPKLGQLRLVDPETGRHLKVDTSSERVRSQFAAAAAEERREVAAEIALDRGAARRAADARRLAARSDRLPATRGRAMSFSSPIALLALILVPIAAVGYVLFERRRVREAAAFVEPALLPNVVDRVPGWRRHLPAALLLLAVAAFLIGFARPHATVSAALRGGDGDHRDRHVALDGRDGRRADEARRRPGLGAPLPRRPAREVPRLRRRVQHAGAGRGRADDRPRVRRDGALRAARRPGDRARRRARDRGRRRARHARGRQAARRREARADASSSCSPTARSTAGASSSRRRSAARARRRSPSSPRCSAPRRAS